jgi:nitrogenase subunit NifH
VLGGRLGKMQTRREVLAAVACVAGLALAGGCDSEPKAASTATLFNKEEVHGAIQDLDSQIGP